jgi:predicted flap endonuclease-1-like 5' DNA nuclease
LTQPPVVSVTTQLEQRLGATQIELRKLGSERHTLRARLRREADRLRELESALRAEKDLRAQASDEHFAAILGLRSRLAEVETERDAESARLRRELEQARTELGQAQSELGQVQSELGQVRSELGQARSELGQAQSELEQARSDLAQARSGLQQARSSVTDAAPAPASGARAGKAPQGLRRIRGIGPAYQRVLEQAGVTRVQQVARWTEAELVRFAEKLKIRPDRISKDDWIGQAKSLDPDPED